ncbi:hypothetical protein CcaCcLH18_05771 [Colletotrichum camelliae]|nr:hypothetical protein CcaCcLH18_05771 [Colletotrichum camelliae]
MALHFPILQEVFPDSGKREEFVKMELGKCLQSEEKVLRVFEQMRESLVKDFLNTSYPRVSQYYFDSVLCKRSWEAAMNQVSENLRKPFPWPLPSLTPRDDADEATWIPELRKQRAMEADFTPAQRLKAGLPLMEEEPIRVRTKPGMSSIELRQKIWDDVFPGRKCAEGRPFEFGGPPGVNYGPDVFYDQEELRKWLPPCVRFDLVDRESRRAKNVNGYVFGYAEGTVDTSWNRAMLAMAYNVAVDWARKVYTTRESTPLSGAFKNFKPASLFLDDVSEAMGNLPLDDDARERADAAIALGRHRTEDGFARLRVAQWLEQNKENTDAADRCKMLRDWCEQPHVNLEGMDAYDIRLACRDAWEAKIKQWQTRKNPVLYLAWDNETKYAREMAHFEWADHE